MTYKPKLARTISLPAPITGWNARDSLAAMASTDAVTLQNYWPNTTDVQFRKGYTRFAYGFSANPETLMWYSSGTANKLFALEGTKGWNITAGGDFTSGSPDLTGLTNARWENVNITTAGGSFLLMVNGVDKLRGYNGTAWYVDGDASHDITVLNTAQATNINLHKNRVWFTQTGTLKAWYLGTNAISGAATAFDLSAVAQKGGYLVAMATWTIDAGYGVDDLAVWITSNGEVIVYRGTDPASVATWALVGVFSMGAPIGRRCMMKYGGDLLVLTQDGIVPLAQGLQSSRLDPRVNLTDKIQSAVSDAATFYSGNFGWSTLYYAKANMLILNVPFSTGSNQQQFCMNTISKAWCNFVDVEANCWGLFNDEPYFGGVKMVGRFWNGFSDFPSTTAQTIDCFAIQAYNDCRVPGKQKHFRMLQPILNTNGIPAIFANVNVDFDLLDNSASLQFAPVQFGLWDSAIWDSSRWGGSLGVRKAWQGANMIGQWMAVVLKGSSYGIETHWMATTVVFADGGIL